MKKTGCIFSTGTSYRGCDWRFSPLTLAAAARILEVVDCLLPCSIARVVFTYPDRSRRHTHFVHMTSVLVLVKITLSLMSSASHLLWRMLHQAIMRPLYPSCQSSSYDQIRPTWTRLRVKRVKNPTYSSASRFERTAICTWGT